MNFDKLLPQILDLAALDKTELDAVALATAKLSFYDWLVVSCAGSTEPLANIMRDFIASEGGATTATVTGTTQKYPARAAALVNGAISHALDYDDTHFAYVGHPSVAIFPAALAAAEEVGASAVDVCRRSCLVPRSVAALAWFWGGGIMMPDFIKPRPLAVLVPPLRRRGYISWTARLCAAPLGWPAPAHPA